MSNEPQADQRITDYVMDEMTDSQRREFETEMTNSSELQRRVSELRETVALLREGLLVEELVAGDRTCDAASVGVTEPSTAGEKVVREQPRRMYARPWLVAIVSSFMILTGISLVPWPKLDHLASSDKSVAGRVTVPEPGAATEIVTQQKQRARSSFDELVDQLETTVPPESYAVRAKEGKTEGFTSGLALDVSQKEEVVFTQPQPVGKKLSAKHGDYDPIELTNEAISTDIAPLHDTGPSVTVGLDPVTRAPRADLDMPSDQSEGLGIPVTGGSDVRAEVATKEQHDYVISEERLADPSPGVPALGMESRLPAHDLLGDLYSPTPERLEELAKHRNQYRSVDPTTVELESKLSIAPGDGAGPDLSGDQFDAIIENEFLHVSDAPLSTFSIDTDTASYSKIRSFIGDHHQLPRPGMVRIEEMVNYFSYNYAGPEPADERPFAAHLATSSCPWNAEHRLVRVALKGRELDVTKRPASNLVFLLDVSGSMDEPNKFPLMVRALKMLTEQLTENDRVAIVVYAGAAGLVLDSTTGDHPQVIEAALDRLRAGGSTNGGEGIALAYQHALDHFIAGGTNRVILCTDGDFNVGTTSTDALVELVVQQAKAGVFLTVLGFGTGNLNDSLLEQISNRGNGNYAFVDSVNEARKVLVEQMASTIVVLAKDVKLQVEFNPNRVASYRLLGYENRVLAARDFNDDTKDAGEIGPGHTVTALYEIVPVALEGKQPSITPSAVDPLKYQQPSKATEAANSDELLTLKLRYKQPTADTSQLESFTLKDNGMTFQEADRDLQFAAAVAAFGMILRDSKFKGNATLPGVLEIAQATIADSDRDVAYRREFVDLVRKAIGIAGR